MGNLIVRKEGADARVSLNRPDLRNALDSALIADLERAFRSLGQDGDVRSIVLSGEGKVFCAGADVNWMRASLDLSAEENRKDAQGLADMLRAIDECPKPVIGRIQGAAMGGGAGLVAVCDIVVAADDAKLAFSEVRLGILPAVISSFVLPKIGAAQARRYFLTAEVFTAGRAREIGLVHEVVPADQLDAKVKELAAALHNNGPKAVAEAKALIRAVVAMKREDALRHSVETIARVRTSPEGQEGLRAFLDKRPPSWFPRT
jgi:methylglutaconyl-CoA hydratase